MLQIKNAGSRWKVGCKGQGHSKDFKKPVFISYLNTLQTDTSDVMRCHIEFLKQYLCRMAIHQQIRYVL